MVDSHLHSYSRCKFALVEDGPSIKPYDENRWVETPECGPDLVDWTARRYDLRVQSRGREGRWDWGCLGTSDSGFVLLVARDSGCVRFSGGSLWSDDCYVTTLIHDRLTKASTFPQNTTFSRSLWAYPGAHRVCPSSKRPEPPAWDSLAGDLCRVKP